MLACVGCRPREVPIDAAPPGAAVTLAPDEELLYVDLAARVRRARGVAAIPTDARRVVATEGPDGPGGAVWIADASTTPPGTALRATRNEFERRALAALPPAAGSRIDVPELERGDVAPPPRGIVVYGTAWCGACADARAWLEARGVVHTFRDVERDAEAARDAAATCAEVGAPHGRIPVIDVAGRVLVGFDPVRLATILGEPI